MGFGGRCGCCEERDGAVNQYEFSDDPSVMEWQESLSQHRYTYPATAGDQPAVVLMPRAVPQEDGKHRAEDAVSMPSHYTQLPVECIDVTEHFGFCLGNAIKYIWRADHKGKPVEDLRKAAWYIEREIARRCKSEN